MSWNTLKQVRKPVAAPRSRGSRGPGKTASKLSFDYIASAAAKGCDGCPLNTAKMNTPKMEPSGAAARETDVYILGDSPSPQEDEDGRHFVGAPGRVLSKQIPEQWQDRIRYNHVIRCRTPANRDPALVEIECCRKQQEEDIAHTKPKLIIGFGPVPLEWFLPGMKKINAWRGRLAPVQVGEHACWFMPSLAPSYIAQSGYRHNGDAIEDVFRSDLARAFAAVDKLPPPTIDSAATKNEGVVLLRTLKDIEGALEEAATWPEYGIDLETSGIRPYVKNARILTCAVSSYEETFVFPIAHRESGFDARTQGAVKKALLRLLLKGGKPIAHQSKFEQVWLAQEFGPQAVHGVDWQDTMAQAYVLDEREGAKSLEAVSLLYLGLNVKALSRPLRMDDLDSEPLDDVLYYNAYDAKYVVPIFFLQQDQIAAEKLEAVYVMQNRRSGSLALMERKGIIPDFTVAETFHVEYQEKIKDCERRIQNDPDVKKFVKKHGRFLSSSPKDLLELLYHTLGFKQCEVKEKGKTRLSTEEEVLEKIDHPLCKTILEMRGYAKLDGTYIVSLCKDGKYIAADNLVHATFSPHRTSTGRLSAEDPNLQNFPMRDPVARRIRSIIVARKNEWLVATDYGQIEARVIAMAAKCPVLTDALWEGYDIHGEWAKRIAHAYPQRIGGKKFLNDKAVLKELRNDVKNGWTFPLFYGSVLESVAGNLNVPVDKLRPLHDEFWESFSAVADWQEALRKFYQKYGYIVAPTGRRRHAPLSWNEIINSGIQGAASDIVVESLDALSLQAYEQDLPQLQAVINVHDDLTFYIPDATLERDLDLITREMVRPRYSWVSVPIVVEVKVGKNWCDMEEVARISSEQFGHRRAA